MVNVFFQSNSPACGIRHDSTFLRACISFLDSSCLEVSGLTPPESVSVLALAYLLDSLRRHPFGGRDHVLSQTFPSFEGLGRNVSLPLVLRTPTLLHSPTNFVHPPPAWAKQVVRPPLRAQARIFNCPPKTVQSDDFSRCISFLASTTAPGLDRMSYLSH